jgi:hypothetical protein
VIGNGKLFISHAHEDNDRCVPLLDALDAWRIDYWFDKQRMRAGQGISTRIQQALEERDILLRICTSSAQRSYWVGLGTDAFRGLMAEDHKRGFNDKRALLNLFLDESYKRQPFDLATVYIDAIGQPVSIWLQDLHWALDLDSEPNTVLAPGTGVTYGLNKVRHCFLALGARFIMSAGSSHAIIEYGEHTARWPNPHDDPIDDFLLGQILKQLGISHDEFFSHYT